jgi:hypothetical protein
MEIPEFGWKIRRRFQAVGLVVFWTAMGTAVISSLSGMASVMTVRFISMTSRAQDGIGMVATAKWVTRVTWVIQKGIAV